MGWIATETAERVCAATGQQNLDRAVGVALRNTVHVDQMSERLAEMQVRLEAADTDAAKQFDAYMVHVRKVSDLLGATSEEDMYERIRIAGNMRALCSVAMAGRGDLLKVIEERAEQLAAMHTANAALFRQNLVLQQKLAEYEA